MTAYYNEFDPYAAQWLRNLIAAGHIAPGVVDERSIADVEPDELSGFTQCHFFAGIGVWSYSLRLAGWPDDRPVWTGSCPCQPFSAAGKGGGFDDERHLWPAFFYLICQCRPDDVLGEQVASKDGLGWLDLVSADMEAAGYAFGAVDTCSAGSGAPHIRQRLRFAAKRMGHADSARTPSRIPEPTERESGNAKVHDDGGDRLFRPGARRPEPCGLAYADSDEQRERRDDRGSSIEGLRPDADGCVDGGGLDNSAGPRHVGSVEGAESDPRHEARVRLSSERRGQDRHGRPGPTNGFWRDADWLFCRDGKWRPVEPGTSPLADGAPARVGRLRAYGNAVDAEATRDFIGAYLDSETAVVAEASA